MRGWRRPWADLGFHPNLVHNCRLASKVSPAARRLAADAARTDAESEYEKMLATLQGWRWRAVLNGVATAAVVGGALLGLQALLPPLSGTLDLRGVPGLQALAVGAGVAFGAVMTLRAQALWLGRPTCPVGLRPR